jgi:hypothetical protein
MGWPKWIQCGEIYCPYIFHGDDGTCNLIKCRRIKFHRGGCE